MYIEFKEAFDLPVNVVYPYFKTPIDWMNLYGKVKGSKNLKNGWQKIPLKNFPAPLIEKIIKDVPEKEVRYKFGGFWRGIAEIRFYEREGQTIVEGYEYITAHGFWLLAPFVEKHFMEKEFKRIWELGWERLRKS